jgi:DNA (cytosine-5)-methyltransferase 1
MSKGAPWAFHEFFAGGGMARLGLGARWRCAFANEICEKKAAAYRANFGPSPELRVEDVWRLKPADVPANAMLAWGSFPCQDLSLAGNGTGLTGARSGTFVPFWRLVSVKRPPLAALENVAGIFTTNEGRDFTALFEAIARSGYRAGALLIDAVHFVPQSRPRVFVVALRNDVPVPPELQLDGPDPLWHPPKLVKAACAAKESGHGQAWVWWRLPAPPMRRTTLANMVEAEPSGVQWHSSEETERLVGMMSDRHRQKLRQAEGSGGKIAGTLYRRMRQDGNGGRVQRAEVRFDGVSGCLRTPAGGSSRQSVLIVERDSVRSRLLSAREAARLMGLPDSYRLPARYNEAYHVAGDGVVVPAVSWLEENLLAPLARAAGGALSTAC